MDFSLSLAEWAKDKPLSILQLDPADRAVLKIAGKSIFHIYAVRVKDRPEVTFVWGISLLSSRGGFPKLVTKYRKVVIS